jgi:molecular chaperone GrpE
LAKLLTTTFANNFYLKMKTEDQKHDEQMDNMAEELELTTDESVNGSQHLNNPLEERQDSDILKAKIEELNDKYLRQVAEFDNFRRRSAKERMELIQTAGREVLVSLLDVLDDCERAQKQLEATDDVQQIKEGVQLVFTKLRNTLFSKGLVPMETKGQNFNADMHEAITEVETTSELKGKVIDEVIKGYYLNDKIIRYAKVVVGK